MPDACVPRDVFNKISKACEGKAWCLVKLPDVPCDIQHKMAISVRYRCYTGNQNQNRLGNEDHENRRRHGH